MTAAEHRPTVPGLTGLSVVARGGYATIYRATQELLARDVAVKIENRTLESDRDRRRFLREARAAGRMSSHPHVVDLYDAGVTAEGHPYLVMELCEGSYAERIKQSPLSPAEACDVGVKIADALADAHALGVLHRDVKPANILISRFGEPALADFGLAILTEVRDASVTLDVLTPAYAPPEMFRHAPPSPAADVYSLSATLYALMYGKPPRWRHERDPSLVSVVDLFSQPVPDLPGVPRDLLRLLRRGMSNVEHERPTAAELRDALLALQLGALSGESIALEFPGTSRPPGTTEEAADEPTMPYGIDAPSPRNDEPTGPGGGSIGVTGSLPPPAGTGSPLPLRSQSIGRGVAMPRLTTETWRAVGWGVGAGLLVLLAVVGGLVWYAGIGRGAGATFHSGQTTSACPLPRQPEMRCVTKAECYDKLTVTNGIARARPLACTTPHTWEAFATADLPVAVTGVEHTAVKQNAEVQKACSRSTLGLLSSTTSSWQVEVLPPTPEEFRAGTRTYRCLAGLGPDRLREPRFAPAGS